MNNIKVKLLLISFTWIIANDGLFAHTLEGLWKVNKRNTELILEIKGGIAKYVSLSSTKEFTGKIIGGTQYDNIVSIGPNKWKANRYTWRFNGTSREEQEDGWWTQVADSELSLSEDGNTLSASGHWTWKRVNPFKLEGTTSSIQTVNSPNSQEPLLQNSKILSTFETEYEGVKFKYWVYLSGANKRDTCMLVKMSNTHLNYGARIIFANGAGKIAQVDLNPGNLATQNNVKYPFEVLIEFYPYEPEEKSLSEEVFDWVKKTLKATVQVEKNGEIKYAIFGIRG